MSIWHWRQREREREGGGDCRSNGTSWWLQEARPPALPAWFSRNPPPPPASWIRSSWLVKDWTESATTGWWDVKSKMGVPLQLNALWPLLSCSALSPDVIRPSWNLPLLIMSFMMRERESLIRSQTFTYVEQRLSIFIEGVVFTWEWQNSQYDVWVVGLVFSQQHNQIICPRKAHHQLATLKSKDLTVCASDSTFLSVHLWHADSSAS